MNVQKSLQEFDATGKSIGRLSVLVANALRSKDKPSYLPNKEPLSKIIVFNTDKLSLPLKKQEQKKYYSHSGYPGGLSEEPLESLYKRDSREIIKRAVYGMLPKNKLRDKLMTNLVLYKGEIK